MPASRPLPPPPPLRSHLVEPPRLNRSVARGRGRRQGQDGPGRRDLSTRRSTAPHPGGLQLTGRPGPPAARSHDRDIGSAPAATCATRCSDGTQLGGAAPNPSRLVPPLRRARSLVEDGARRRTARRRRGGPQASGGCHPADTAGAHASRPQPGTVAVVVVRTRRGPTRTGRDAPGGNAATGRIDAPRAATARQQRRQQSGRTPANEDRGQTAGSCAKRDSANARERQWGSCKTLVNDCGSSILPRPTSNFHARMRPCGAPSHVRGGTGALASRPHGQAASPAPGSSTRGAYVTGRSVHNAGA